jgi:hypothetical protein
MGKGLPWERTCVERVDNTAMRAESTKILSKECCSGPEMKLKRPCKLVDSSVLIGPKEGEMMGARRREMVGLGRVELPTNGLGNRCSIHLSYRPFGLFYRIRQTEWNRACEATMFGTCIGASESSAILPQKPRDRAALNFKGALESLVADASA